MPGHRARVVHAFARASTVVLALAVLVYELVDRDGLTRQLKQEHSDQGAGLIENLTFFVLLPGIACAAWALWNRRERSLATPRNTWLLAWTLACIYFAGEEVSWGYWYFGWETPELVARLNDQGETNLHNMSSWMDQKPRALVELFVFTCGVVLPLLHARRRGATFSRSDRLARVERWIVAPTALVPAGLFFLAVRIAKHLPEPISTNLGDSELRELAIAWFLGLYLLSLAARLPRAVPSNAERAAVPRRAGRWSEIERA